MSKKERINLETNEGFNQLKKRLKAIIRKYPVLKGEEQDIIQEIALKMIKKPASKQTLHQAVVDIIRKRFGNRPNKALKNKKSKEARENKLALLGNSDRRVALEEVTLYVQPHENLEGFMDLIKELKPSWRAMFILHYIWGFNYSEIAVVFFVSESRVSQIHKEALSLLKSTHLGFDRMFKH